MKVKAYRTVCEEIELPDKYFELDPNALHNWESKYRLTDDAYNKYMGNGNREFDAIEDMDGKLIAEW